MCAVICFDEKCFSLRCTVCKDFLEPCVWGRNPQAIFAFESKSTVEKLVNGTCQSGSLVKYQKELWEFHHYLKVLTELDLHVSGNWLCRSNVKYEWTVSTVSESCLFSHQEVELKQRHVPESSREQNELKSRCPCLTVMAFIWRCFFNIATIHHSSLNKCISSYWVSTIW